MVNSQSLSSTLSSQWDEPVVQHEIDMMNTNISYLAQGHHKPTVPPFHLRYPITTECLAEGFGTFVELMFGLGTTCTLIVHNTSTHWFVNSLAWGIGTASGRFVSGGVSASYGNPALTITSAAMGKFPWNKVIPYLLAQFIGAFAAAWVIYIVLFSCHPNVLYDDNTSRIFITGAQEMLLDTINYYGAFFIEFTASSMYIGGYFAIVDVRRQESATPAIRKFMIFLLTTGVALAFGYETGFGINPFRDFAPRVMLGLLGWQTAFHETYFFIPLIAPVVGGLVGALLQELCVGMHFNKESKYIL